MRQRPEARTEPDLEQVRVSRNLTGIALVACIGVGTWCVLSLLFAPAPIVSYLMALAYIGCGGFIVFTARRNTVAASHTLVVMNLTPGVLFLFIEGPHTGHFGILFIVVVMAGMLVSRRASLLYGSISVTAAIASYLAAEHGLIVVSTPSADSTWVDRFAQLFVVGLVSALLGSSLRGALADLRTREAQLAARNRDLDASQRALTLSERNLARLVENSPDGILFLGTDGICVSCNAAASRIFGVPTTELRGMSTVELGLGDGPAQDLGRLTGELLQVEVDTPTRGRRQLEINGCLIEEQSSIIGAEIVCRDVTALHAARQEQQRLRDELSQSRRLESLGRLAGGVAHDFNNLLTVVIGNADFIKLHEPLSRSSTEALDEILDAGIRATAVIRQLLTFGRGPERGAHPFDVRHTLERAERLFRRFLGPHIELVVSLPEEPAVVVMGQPQLDQVLMNLVLNAQEAMPHGGRLEISVDVDVFTAGSRPPIRMVRLQVSDCGDGMSASVRDHLFELFFSTKADKTNAGLGMSVVKRIVDEADGHIELHSVEGEGTNFTLLFPEAGAPNAGVGASAG